MNRRDLTLGVNQAIERRCSVRSYAPGSLDRDIVERLLAAAVRAPTAMHAEPWAFVVVQDVARLRQLSDTGRKLFVEDIDRIYPDRAGTMLGSFRQPDFDIFYNAGTLIVICAARSNPFAAADCWLAAENLMLAATDLGLGTCVIGAAVAGLNLPETKAGLGIPPDMDAVAPIVAGIPAGRTTPSSRKPPQVLAWK